MSSVRKAHADAILASLAAVEHERERRLGDLALAQRVNAVKRYQQARFRLTHADFMANPRYGAVAHFFLEELYGPADFAQRDAQFARIVPALVRLFPPEIVGTVRELAELHALSESLDTALAQALPSERLEAKAYVLGWRGAGRAQDRERQVALTLAIGTALDRYTRMPVLTASLRLMRGPARAAGLSELQAFLERGFETFKGMGGAEDFLAAIGERERSLAAQLFEADVDAVAASGQLP